MSVSYFHNGLLTAAAFVVWWSVLYAAFYKESQKRD